MTGALLGVAVGHTRAAASESATPASLFVEAERLQLTDHARFVATLNQLHQEASQLSPAQRWHLRYLDAYRASLEGLLARAAPILRDVIDHSGDPALATRATAKLINSLAINHHYEEAFKLANALMADLPRVTDSKAHAEALRSIVQMLGLAGESDRALKYAQQLAPERASAENRCGNYSYKLNAMTTPSADDPELRRAIAVCVADKQAIYANTLRLVRADALKDEGRTDQAIALLKSIEPSILRAGFQPHIADLHVSLALDYVKLGNDADARQAALAAVAASDPGGFTWPLQAGYELLYQIEKRAGNDEAALGYYEKYVLQFKAGMDDAKTRALAYQMVEQDVLSKKMKLDALGKQNRILELRQALASQAQETSNLLIALLLVVLAFIVGAMFWLRRSQLRFRRMARRDGLTGAFNRGYFFDKAGRVVRRLHKTDAEVCLVVLDMDHFKRVNDTHGHPAGDEVLRHTVTVCRSELRDSDVFGRLGGEEFGILMPACSRDQGIEIASRIRHRLIEKPLALDAQNAIPVSASFGLACSDVSGHRLDQLFADADAALYRAKEGGRNQLVATVDADTSVTARADIPAVEEM